MSIFGGGFNAYVLGAEEAYRAGSIGIAMEDMNRNGFNADLTDAQKKLAYDLGKAMRQEQRTEKAALSGGGIVYEQGVDAQNLTKTQKASVKVAEVLSNAIGGKVHLYSSTQSAEGVRTADQQSIRDMIGDGRAPNGFYDHKTGDIYIDINAGANGEGTILYTLSHEYTHLMRQNAPESFGKLAEHLFKLYSENGEDVDALVQEKQKKLGVDYDTAYEEVVADSMEAMLTDTNAAERIAELKKTDKTAWQKLRDLVRKLLDSIRSLYKDLAPNSFEGQRVREMGNALEQLSDLFVEGLSEVSRESGKGEGKISFSVREIRDNAGKSYGVGVYLDSTLLENLTDKERVQMVRERVKELGGQSFTAYDANGNAIDIKIAENGARFVNKHGKSLPVNNDLVTKNRKSKIKQESVVLADEMISTARYKKSSPAKYSHGWLDNNGKNAWTEWKTYVQDREKAVWEATLHIATSESGQKYLYDIDPIKKVEQSGNSDTSTTKNNVPQRAQTVNRKISKQERYMSAAEQGDTATAQKLVDEAAKEAGYTIKAYHGTARADRVGTVFRPDRATSGPMAFFTDNRDIASNYARDKADTSLDYDSEYDDYYTQFRVERNGKSLSVGELWNKLSPAERAKIKNAAPHIRFDDDYEQIIYDPSAQHGNGAYDAYELNRNRGNVLNTLVSIWLETGDLYNRESDFLAVLKLAGVTDAEYRDPDARYEKVYDTYLKIRNPFDTSTVDRAFYDDLSTWTESADLSAYESETANADMLDKRNVTPARFLERISDDIDAGTSHAWTSIPDFVTAYLKERGYDGIKDTGGKGGGEAHTVWIPFSSEQVKSAEAVTRDDNGNIIPLSERFNSANVDIRYQERGLSNREILASALDSAAQNPREREVLAEYKDAIGRVEGYEARLNADRAELKRLSFAPGKP